MCYRRGRGRGGRRGREEREMVVKEGREEMGGREGGGEREGGEVEMD